MNYYNVRQCDKLSARHHLQTVCKSDLVNEIGLPIACYLYSRQEKKEAADVRKITDSVPKPVKKDLLTRKIGTDLLATHKDMRPTNSKDAYQLIRQGRQWHTPHSQVSPSVSVSLLSQSPQKGPGFHPFSQTFSPLSPSLKSLFPFLCNGKWQQNIANRNTIPKGGVGNSSTLHTESAHRSNGDGSGEK
jgi:hypothetical protein